MEYEELSEKSLDDIMHEIRKEVGLVQEDECDRCIDSGLLILKEDPELEFMEMHSNKAGLGTQIGLRQAPMTRKKGISKKIAKIVEKVFLRIAQLITRDIREFNAEILLIVQSTMRKFSTIENNEKLFLDELEKMNVQNNILEKNLQLYENNFLKKIEKNNHDMENNFLELEQRLKAEIQVFENNLTQKIESLKEETIDECKLKEIESEIKKQIEYLEEKVDKNLKKESESLNQLVGKINEKEIAFREINEKIYELNGKMQWKNSNKFLVSIDSEVTTGEKQIDNALFYHDFEEHFRGTREDIKERLKIYLPIVKTKIDSWENKTFIDLGCGRGEWLDLLGEEGVTDYTGVDLNGVQLEICKEYGHAALQKNDCLIFLKGLQENTVDVITGFQIIEHLTTDKLLELFRECMRVLRRNGIILFETPNVNNLITGASYFYADPTHNKPLIKDVVKFYVERTGFVNVQIIEVNPARYSKKLILPTCFDGNQNIWNENISILNDLLYGAQDYAVLGVKK